MAVSPMRSLFPLSLADSAQQGPLASGASALDRRLGLIVDLGVALEQQCRNAHSDLLYRDASPEARSALEAMASNSQEVVGRARALLALREEDPAKPTMAAVTSDDDRPAPSSDHDQLPPDSDGNPSSNGSEDDPDTRECAVSLALTLKLDGASPEHVEERLHREFGREDAREIVDQAFLRSVAD